MKKRTIVILGAVLVIILSVSLYIKIEIEKPKKAEKENYKKNAETYKLLTIDGYDAATGTTIQKINVWSDYEKRTYAFSLNHGDKVSILDRGIGSGNNWVRIKDNKGRTGYITDYFVREFKYE
jgi:uncharacterized protein YpmB